MISRLKRKVVILTTASLLVLLLFMVSGMNIISFVSLTNESDEILSMISESGGKMPEQNGEKPDEVDFVPKEMPHKFSPELQFETRYFSVVITGDGQIVRTDTGKIASVDGSQAGEYGRKVIEKNSDKGFIGNFRYLKSKDQQNFSVIFLDCTRKLDSMRTFLFSSVIMSLAGFLIVVLVMIVISGKIIRPISESYEKQKRFITDAGHELKTPLAIINANIDLIEDEVADKESVEDIRTQTHRLKNLTEDLITLSRLEEGPSAITRVEFDASKTAFEMANNFKAPAATKGINFSISVAENLTLNGDKNSFEKLISIFLDNAVKYTPQGEKIEFTIEKTDKSAVIMCKNTTVSEITKENVAHVFDRFYRTDFSRNSETGGHGIGLSVAKAMVLAHGGKISASAPDAHTFIITATLPL